jgi:predicted amidophosphoribosyltransferase
VPASVIRRPSTDRAALDYAFPSTGWCRRSSTGIGCLSRLFVELMAAHVTPEADLVVPMPLHVARLRRGASTRRPSWRGRWRGVGLPLRSTASCDVDTLPQAGLPWKARAANVRGAFRVRGGGGAAGGGGR